MAARFKRRGLGGLTSFHMFAIPKKELNSAYPVILPQNNPKKLARTQLETRNRSEREAAEKGYAERPHLLTDLDRNVIKTKNMSPSEARERNASIRDLGYAWVLGPYEGHGI